MEQDIERAENLIKKCDKCKLKECINCEISCTDVKAIEHLIKAYKELKENSIPVSLIQKEIEELKEIADEDNKEEYIKISALKALLEKRNINEE